ncbi:MAG TPA: fibronectin type III domain-containing protein [Terriglobia bacterium]|nr:fibronectin type III domain-containing protein [Terriglobia bacterium]
MRISDLAIAQKGPALELTFTRPTNATDGERLTKPLEIEIFRTTTKPGERLSATPPGSGAWITLSTHDLDQFSEGGKIKYLARFSDPEFAQLLGASFTFSVRGLTHGFRNHALESEPSNIVRATLLDVSGPVENLQIKTTEKALVLDWAPPRSSLSGRALTTLSGYRVYWSQTGKPSSFQIRGESAAPTFSDSNFVFGQNYFYKVRAVFKQGDQVAESEDSAIVPIIPHDTFPPAPPVNVSALFSADAVELVWTANREPDLAGYNVYRREKDGVPQKINGELLRTPTYEDRSVQMGHQYFYRVTSVDLTHNESSPSAEAAVETH